MKMLRHTLWLASTLTGGCSLMGFFDEPPTDVTLCDEGDTRDRERACGLCNAGTAHEVCDDTGHWVLRDCDDPDDGDGDGYANNDCRSLPGGCCTSRFDCNDSLEAVHPDAFDCNAGASGSCTTSCGSTGTHTCSSSCTWEDCVPPTETCNGEDDDCDGTADNGFTCAAGLSEACTTPCGTPGTRTCAADCGGWSACTGPEACNACDDDGDGRTDEDFECVRGASEDCTVDDCPGTRACSNSCAWEPCVARWPTPTVPAPLAPANGAATGSIHAPAERNVLRPVFRWAASEGCPADQVRYELQIDDSCVPGPGLPTCTFPSPEIDETGLTATAFQPPTALAVSTAAPVGRRYYWRVRASYGASSPSAWSPIRYVDVGRAPGDLNGDGYSDVAAGAPNANPGGSSEAGAVRVYLGGAVVDGTADVSLAGGAARDHFGASVAVAGDLNADGFADLVAGAPDQDAAASGAGRVYVFFGRADFSSVATADRTFDGDARDDRFGHVVAGAGDLDADGYADFLVGAPDLGRVFLFRGGPTLAAEAWAVLSGTEFGDRFGAAAAGAGDVDADGFADLIVGAPEESRAYVYRGGTLISETPWWSFSESVAPASAGASVAGAGDVNGDGFADFLVGAASDTEAARRVFLYPGGAAPPALPLFADEVGAILRDALGTAVASAGDPNGDGYADWLLGMPGDALGEAGHVALGQGFDPPVGTSVNVVLSDAEPEARFGEALSPAGDFDGDGYADVVVGAPLSDAGGTWSGAAYLFRGTPEASFFLVRTGTWLAPLGSGERLGFAVAGGAW